MKKSHNVTVFPQELTKHMVLLFVGALVAVGVISSTSPAFAVTCPKINSAGKPSIKPEAKINWSGCDLHNINLKGANLVKANLSGANLTGANLTGANLSQAYLSQANLNKANLTNANIYRASFSGASLVSATLDRTYLDNSYDRNPNIETYMFGPDFSSANLSHATFKSANLHIKVSTFQVMDYGPYFNYARLVSTNFASANLSFGRFDSANISRANLTGAKLKRIHSGQVSGNPAALPTGWKFVNGALIGPSADLTDVVFDESRFSHFTFENVWSLRGARFIGATLEWTTFKGGDCPTFFNQAQLKFVKFQSSDCTWTQFTDANLLNVSSDDNSTFDSSTFVGASIRDDINDSYILSGTFTNCDFTGANLEGVNFGPKANFGSASEGNLVTSSGITGNPWSLPLGWQLVNGTLQKSYEPQGY